MSCAPIMTPDEVTDHLRDAGLTGWKGLFRRVDCHVVAVLTPPDFNPAVDPKRMRVGRGRDHAAALAQAIDRARTLN